MAEGDTKVLKRDMTFSKCRVPLVGALVDCVETSLSYIRTKTFRRAELLQEKTSKATLSAPFLAFVCLVHGLVCNMKFEVVTLNEEPLGNDLHLVLLSKGETLYVNDIDTSKIMWCLEASDCLVLLISCLLILYSSKVRSPLREYMFLPWLGAALRGLFLRQAPTAGALLYTMAIVNGNLNPLFLTAFTFLFLLEARLWLEIGRLICARWETRLHRLSLENHNVEADTLFTNEDVQSVEMQNFVY